MAEGARLESVYTATYRGFESPPHRHIREKSSYESTGFFFAYCTHCGGMRTHDRGSTTGGSQLDRPRTQRAGCPQGERSESIPPSPPYSEKELVRKYGLFFHLLHIAGWRRTRLIRPTLPDKRSDSSPPYSEKSTYESTGFFFTCCTSPDSGAHALSGLRVELCRPDKRSAIRLLRTRE